MSARQLLRAPVYWESVVLCLLCLVDALVTVLVIGKGWAKEANPLMAFFIEQGVFVFLVAKVASFLPGVVACEYLKSRNPSFALLAIRAGTLGYLAVYVIGDLRINNLL